MLHPRRGDSLVSSVTCDLRGMAAAGDSCTGFMTGLTVAGGRGGGSPLDLQLPMKVMPDRPLLSCASCPADRCRLVLK